ncbi:MAG: hypothetical protein D3923_15960, partial [Candidatus Electrothrix sp. AR3]|nr:hypothetical protein [Candidatus Electrothrix sp. AR3]
MFPLAPFLRILEQDGFRLTLREYDRIALVLATENDWSLTRLRSVLLTLLAKNEDERDRFDRRFSEFFAELPEEEATLRAIDLERIKAELEQLRAGPVPFLDGSRGRREQSYPAKKGKQPWVGWMLSFCLFILLSIWPGPLQEERAKVDPAQIKETVEPVAAGQDLKKLPLYRISPRQPVIASRELSPVVGNPAWQQTAWLALALFLLCLGYALYLYQAQKVPRDQPVFWPRDVSHLPRLFPLDK